jgi:hypothetical protein
MPTYAILRGFVGNDKNMTEAKMMAMRWDSGRRGARTLPLGARHSDAQSKASIERRFSPDAKLVEFSFLRAKEFYRYLARYVSHNTGSRLEGFSQPSPNLGRPLL